MPLPTNLPSSKLVLLAVLVGIPALLMMAASVVYPKPLMVVGAMSIGQGLGALALLCYLAAIVTEVRRKAGSEPGDGQRRQ